MMRKIPAVLCALMLAVSAAHAVDKNVSGIITTATWTADTVYHVTGTLLVPPGETLTIAGGTSVVFDADVPLIVAGSLVAQGVQVGQITLSAGQSSWTGLRVLGTASMSAVTISGAHGNGENPDSLASRFDKILDFLKDVGGEQVSRPAAGVSDLVGLFPEFDLPDLSDVDWEHVNLDSIAPYTGVGVISAVGPQASLDLAYSYVQNNNAEGIGGVIVAAGAHADITSSYHVDNASGATDGVKFLGGATGSLAHTSVAGNASGLGLGGVLVQGCEDVSIRNCVIQANSLGAKVGGALTLADSGSVTVSRTHVVDNVTGGPFGNVLVLGRMNARFDTCFISGGSSAGLAAGMAAVLGPVVTMRGCIFVDNVVRSDSTVLAGLNLPIPVSAVGGGLLVADADVSLRSSDLAVNTGGVLTGGGLTALTLGVFNTSVTLDHCQITLNEGGAITALGALSESSDATTTIDMINCTVADNTNEGLPLFAGLAAVMGAEVNILNSILWDGTYATVGRPMILNEIPTSYLPEGSEAVSPGVVTAQHSDIMVAAILFSTAYPGTGNIKLNPRFQSGSYELASNSPCINAGSPASPLEQDGSIADMGAITTSPPTSVAQEHGPESLTLSQNAPNPFNPTTSIAFSTVAAGRARLAVYNLAGQVVVVLSDGVIPAGAHTVTWNGRNALGRAAASGVYLYRLEFDGDGASRQLVRRMTLVR